MSAPQVETPPAAAPTTEPEQKSPASEFEPIMPELRPGGTVVLGKDEFQLHPTKAPGIPCKIGALRTRHLLQLGRILTGSTRPLDLNALFEPIATAQVTGTDTDKWAAWAAGITTLFLTVPHSEEEFIALIRGLVNPVEELPDETLRSFYTYLDNPSPGDTIAIIQQLVANEAPKAAELGKVFNTMLPGLMSQQAQSSKPDSPKSESPGQQPST